MNRSTNLASRDLEDIGGAKSTGTADDSMAQNPGGVSSFDGNLYGKGAPIKSDGWIGSWRWDIRTDTMLWSEQLYRIVGREHATIPPFREHFRFYTSESWIRLVDATLGMLKTGTPYELRLQMLHTDGSRKWVICYGEAVGNERGEIVELRGTVQDLTEYASEAGKAEPDLQAESNAEDATRRLIQAQEEENARLVAKFRDNVCQQLAVLAARIQSFRAAFSDLHSQSDAQIEPLWHETPGMLSDLDLPKPGPVAPGFND